MILEKECTSQWHDKLKAMRKLRLVGGLAFFLVFSALKFSKLIDFPFLLFSIAPLAEALVNQPYNFIIKRVKRLDILAWLHMILDIFFITWGIHFIGGMDALFITPIYCLVILYSGTIISFSVATFFATLASIAYGSLVALEFYDIIPQLHIFSIGLTDSFRLVALIVTILLFYLVAFFSSYLSVALKKKVEALAKAHDNLKKTQGHLIESEKLALEGQLATGVTEELSNPIDLLDANNVKMEKYINGAFTLLEKFDQLEASIKLKDGKGTEEIIAEIDQHKKEFSLNEIKDSSSTLLWESRQSINKVKVIVLDLKSFSHKKRMLKTSVNLNEIIDRVLDLAAKHINRDVEIKRKYGDIPLLLANLEQMEQIFMNLILFAYHSIKEKGVIAIRTHQEDRHICVSLSSTVEGMPEDLINKVHDPCFTDNHMEEKIDPSLSASYGIIKQYKGKFKIENEPGKGSRFIILLPI